MRKSLTTCWKEAVHLRVRRLTEASKYVESHWPAFSEQMNVVPIMKSGLVALAQGPLERSKHVLHLCTASSSLTSPWTSYDPVTREPTPSTANHSLCYSPMACIVRSWLKINEVPNCVGAGRRHALVAGAESTERDGDDGGGSVNGNGAPRRDRMSAARKL